MAKKAADPAQLLRDFAMALPESTEHFPWGERVVKVKGKVFVFLGKGETFGLSVKLPLSGLAALTLPFASPTGYGLGKSGWVTASFAKPAEVPVGMLKGWIEESYRAVAPKALAEKVPEGFAERPTPRKKPSRDVLRKRAKRGPSESP